MRAGLITFLFALAFFVSASTPAMAANLPLLDPNFSIVPPECSECPCNYYGMLQVVQNVINAGVSLGVIAFVLVMVYAGASFMLNPTNPETRTKARSMLLNVVVGMVIVLAAWLVVDFIMKMIYNPDTAFEGGSFGPWNEILASQDNRWCIEETSFKPIDGILGGLAGLGQGNRPRGDGSVILGPPGGGGACSVDKLKTAASQAGISLSESAYNTFACLARYESTCGTRTLNYSWGKGSSAAGAFQVLLDGNSECYETAACRQAAGVSGPLNCGAAFKNGNPIPGNARAQQCVNAAANLACSLAAAECVRKKQGYGAWTADNSKRGQVSCIRQYGT